MSDASKLEGQKREIIRLSLAFSDMRSAFALCDWLAQHTEVSLKADGGDIWRALVHAIVVSYARPFTSNDPIGALSSKWSRFPHKWRAALHKDLMDLRHKAMAHSDTGEKGMRSVRLIPPHGAFGVLRNQSEAIAIVVGGKMLSPVRLPYVRQHAYELGQRLYEAAQRLAERLFGTRILPASGLEITKE